MKCKIIELANKENSRLDRIKIRTKPKFNKQKKITGYSVLFELSKNGKRNYKTLDKLLHFQGSNASLLEDKKKLRMIVALRNKEQNELLQNITGFSFEKNKKDFSTFFKKHSKDSLYICAYKMLQKFIGNNKLYFENIDLKFCEEFARFLENTKLKQNTAHIYYSKFKAVLNMAIREGVIDNSPARLVTVKEVKTIREFLTKKEIEKLKSVKKTDTDTCNAFLFGCLTGMRMSDIRNIKYSDIKEGYISFKQVKTKINQRLKLSSSSLSIIEKQKEFQRNNYVFNLPSNVTVSQHVTRWIRNAGIDKHITFHCSRHTFACLSLLYGIDIYTLSKLLGHTDVKTTQIYAKLMNKQLDDAIDKLPVFEF